MPASSTPNALLCLALCCSCAGEVLPPQASDVGVATLPASSDAAAPDSGSSVELDAGTPATDASAQTDRGRWDSVPCAVPVQEAVNTSSWPEVFVGTAAHGCEDSAAAGTRAKPLCNPHLALARLTSKGRVLTFLDGVYRLDDLPKPDGSRGALGVPNVKATATEFLVLRAAAGAKPLILGSVALSGGWTEHSQSPRVFRRAVDPLLRDVKALYQVVDGPQASYLRARRFRHVMESRSGARSHAPVAALADGSTVGSLETSITETQATRDGTWTKADASGAGCGEGNAGCYLYLRVDDAAFDPNAVSFEASQYAAIGGAGSYLVVQGLHTRFTQCGGLNCSIQFEGVTQALIQDSSFGHVANSDDNSYGLGLWFSNGSIVRRNVVFDSAYWGGVSNSKGITFMCGGDVAPNWVCNNEVFHIPGQAGVTSKGGESNLQVLGNHVHDCTVGIESSHVREQDGKKYPAGNWTVQQNLVERCDSGVLLSRNGKADEQPGEQIRNNLFRDNREAVTFSAGTPPGSRVVNNLFLAGPRSEQCNGKDCGAALYFANNAGEVRDFDYLFTTAKIHTSHNLFHGFAWTHGVNRNWTANYVNRTLAEFQQAFAAHGAEEGSLDADPLLGSDLAPGPGSPLLGTGLPEVSPNIGPFPR